MGSPVVHPVQPSRILCSHCLSEGVRLEPDGSLSPSSDGQLALS